MAELNKAILPKWVMAKDTGENKSVSIPIGLGARVFFKACNTGTGGSAVKTLVCILDAGHDSEGVVGARRDMAIVFTHADDDATRLNIVRNFTKWVARAGSTEITNTDNNRMIYLDGDVLSDVNNFLGATVTDLEVVEDIIA